MDHRRGTDGRTHAGWADGTTFGNPTGRQELNGKVVILNDDKGGDEAEWPESLRVSQHPDRRWRLPSLEITIPLPPRETHPNARCHWAVKARAVKQQREDAFLAAKAALGEAGIGPPRWPAASIQATFYKAGSRAKPSDMDGRISALKATCDGLTDAGVLSDDRGLTWLPPKELLGAAAGGERKVVLLVTEIDNG